jgi:hypothetical protein
LERNFKVLERNFKVLERNFKVLERNNILLHGKTYLLHGNNIVLDGNNILLSALEQLRICRRRLKKERRIGNKQGLRVAGEAFLCHNFVIQFSKRRQIAPLSLYRH